MEHIMLDLLSSIFSFVAIIAAIIAIIIANRILRRSTLALKRIEEARASRSSGSK